MDSLLRPDQISSQLKVVEIEDQIDSEGNPKANATLVATVSDDFAKKYQNDDPRVITNARVNHSIVGVRLNPDLSMSELSLRKNAAKGTLTMPTEITRIPEGINMAPLSETVAPIDSLLGKVVLVSEDERLKPEELQAVKKDIAQQFPQSSALTTAEPTVFTFQEIEMLAQLREEGIDADDIKRFLFGLRSPEKLQQLIRRIDVQKPLRTEVKQGNSAILQVQGFTHEDVIGVFEDSPDAKMVGTRVIFPRSNITAYEQRFLMRLEFLRALYLDELTIPVSFYGSPKKTAPLTYRGADREQTLESLIESFAKVDTDFVPSYPASNQIFDVLTQAPGGAKAVFIKDQEDLKRILAGDQSMVKAYSPVYNRTTVNPLALADDPTLPPHTESKDPSSYAELQALEGIEEGQHGVLFCKYFPNKDVFRRMFEHAGKLRSIVFQAPTYQKAQSVVKSKENYPLEAHIFFSTEIFIALREFHQKFPNIKIVWAHPGINRNLEFVDDGHVPMFAKPEVVEYLKDKDNSVRISFCGSSTVKEGMTDKEKQDVYDEEEAFTNIYCEFATKRGKKPIGINGGGPDVMDRNGEHLQKLGAVSVSSACDLGFAGQTRHDNWDAVLNMQGDSTAFALREEVLLAGDIIHLAPGGIGTIEEILVVLAQNKVGMADKTIILVGKEYWAGQISQFLGSTSKGNIKPHHLKKVFVVDTPDEAKYILEKIDKDKKFLDQRIDKWDKATKAELTQQELLTYK